MDSATALAWALTRAGETGDVEAINFWYGSKHNDREREAAKAVAAHYGVNLKLVDLPFIAEAFKSDLLKTGGEIPEGHDLHRKAGGPALPPGLEPESASGDVDADSGPGA